MVQQRPDEVDLLVVGGGKAGKSLAMDRAKAGWDVAMVERDKIGGTCINVACIPTKALVGSARSLLAARHAGRLGVEIDGGASISLDGLQRHETSVVGGLSPPTRSCSPTRGWNSSSARPGSSASEPSRSRPPMARSGPCEVRTCS